MSKTEKSALVPQITHDEFEAELDYNYAARRSTYIEGPPGVGKTQAVREFSRTLAERHPSKGFGPETHYLEYRPVYMDPVQISGVCMPDRETRTAVQYPAAVWPTEARIEAGDYPEHGVVCLDEMPNAPRMVLNALLELLNDHSINREPLGPGWMVVATGNRGIDNTGSNSLPMALISRIAWYSLIVTPDDLFKYGTRTGRIRTDVLAFYTKVRSDLMMTFDPTRQEPYTCPRSLESMSRKLDHFERLRPGATVPEHSLVSLVGNSAKVFLGMRGVLTQCPTWKEILESPTTCRKPTDRLAVFNTSITIGMHADGTNIDKVYPYVEGLGDDETVNLTMSSVLHRFDKSGLSIDDPKNPMNTATFSKWSEQYTRAKRGL